MSQLQLSNADASTPEARAETGRVVRARVPRSVHGEWEPAPDRLDPTEQLARQEVTRVPELVPLRHERMAASPFAFFRGAAAVFASDLAACPRTDLTVQLCGDAHLENFGGFATPERSLVFDINDFDETHPGPFEWDLKRLVASFEVASRSNGFDDAERHAAVDAVVDAYVVSMRELAEMGFLEVWYSRVSANEIDSRLGADHSRALMDNFTRRVRKAEEKDRFKALKRLTVDDGSGLRFRSDPPLLHPVDELFGAEQHGLVLEIVHRALVGYRRSLQADRRALFERYRFVDLARKVVGVGSVGTRCWVALFVGREAQRPAVPPGQGGGGLGPRGPSRAQPLQVSRSSGRRRTAPRPVGQ